MAMNANDRRLCAACFKSFNIGPFYFDHLKKSHHSVHQPRCGVCRKHCKSFESVREHLQVSDPDRPFKVTCKERFAKGGCSLCLNFFEDATALAEHIRMCRLSPPSFVPPPCNLNTSTFTSKKKAIAISWEMVGGGRDGCVDMCAAVCLVGEDEEMILYTCIKPEFPVTDYREKATGLTEKALQQGIPLKNVQVLVSEILHGFGGHLLVGHDLIHVLDCLKLQYPIHLLRDTAKYVPLMKTNLVSHSLKYLTRSYLGYEINSGKHNLHEDCVSVMRLYKRIRDEGLNSCKESEMMLPQALKMVYDSRATSQQYLCWCLDR